MKIPTFTVIAALDRDHGIAKSGAIPWHLPGDQKRFKEVTTRTVAGRRNVIIMGRKTYESIPPKRRPLPRRQNIVISRNVSLQVEPGVLLTRSLDYALLLAAQLPDIGSVYVIGGGEIYREALDHPSCAYLDLTLIEQRFECDTFFPEFDDRFVPIGSSAPCQDGDQVYSFWTYRRST